ncbi:hypothetical protein GCM10025780_05690 [Frondihabitans cladoniiphilus]|uniref:Uncharacterized protein n=1 Tax=Frondihabitans cladoniiphilus TaxID=715785 RepID=A0ABP8VNR1_9MICO
MIAIEVREHQEVEPAHPTALETGRQQLFVVARVDQRHASPGPQQHGVALPDVFPVKSNNVVQIEMSQLVSSPLPTSRPHFQTIRWVSCTLSLEVAAAARGPFCSNRAA